ncbi:MAG: hypothetical protein HY241_17550 [Actinobacteria bacterium]|nr:hypothetical protein [Actinomycetota bacterium]
MTFDGALAPNRVNPRTGYAALNKFRVSVIHTETGGQVDVNYLGTDCNPAALPAVDSSTGRCFPVYWTPPGVITPQLDWFTKFVVTQTVESDLVGGNPAVETNYTYVGPAAWHYADTDEVTPVARRTWGLWRGYARVEVRLGHGTDGPQQLSVQRFYRGMNGDKTLTGTRTASVTDSQGGVHTDTPGLMGFGLEQQTFNGSSEVAGQVSDPVRVVTATHVHDGLTVGAYMVHTAVTHGRAAISSGQRLTEVDTSYDAHGNPAVVNDLGDLATAADDRCTRYSYATNAAAWRYAEVSEVTVVGVRCTVTPTYPADGLSVTRTYYDSSTTLGALPGAGDATRVDQVKTYTTSGPSVFVSVATTYDAYGRVLTATDTIGRVTKTAYTDTGGLATQTVVTNPLGWTTTEILEPSWGFSTASLDANGWRTDLCI